MRFAFTGQEKRRLSWPPFFLWLPDPCDRKQSVALLKQAGETYVFVTFSA